MLAAGLAATTCIIPDADIDVEPPRTNPGTVRIVQAVSITEAANLACADVAEPDTPRSACPVPPSTQNPGLVKGDDGQVFCVCPEGLVDSDALKAFDVFVEDPDVNPDGTPRDDIFGVFLLDVDPASEDVTAFVAYTKYLNPNEPAQLQFYGDGSYSDPILRDATNVKAWRVGGDGVVDLCNDNDGKPLEQERRLHALRLVVTDRPWYVPVRRDKNGAPMQDGDDFERADVLPLIGVPDIPGGASYAVANFVFECQTEDAQAETAVCACEDPMGEQ